MSQVASNQVNYSVGDYSSGHGQALPFLQFLRSWHSFIRREQIKLRKLTEMSVELHRRDRGLTISDQYGGYGTRPSTEGQWMDYQPDQDGEIYPINIVAPAIATNKNACLQSNAEVIVASANESAEHKQIAMRWQKFFDYVERVGWHEAKRGLIFDATQKDGTMLNRQFIKKATSQSVPSVNENKSGLAVYQCDCGAQGMAGVEFAEEGMTEMECPQCGEKANAMVKPIAGFEMGESEVPVYDIDDEIIPFYNFTIDAYGAKLGGIKTARWLQIQRLRDRPWMETHYPNFPFAGAARWCYQLRCDYALATSDWGWLNGWSRTSGYAEFDHIQEDSVYLHEDAYSNYRSPDDWEFVNSRGIKVFAIKRGQTIGEAQKELYGEDQHGFMFFWTDEVLLDIPSPETECLNFRDCFSDVHWSRGSGSYHSSPNYSIKTIQDTITLVNTLKMVVIASNAYNPVYFNSQVLNQADFSKQYIGTDKAALLPDGKMEGAVYQLPVPTPSPYLDSQLQFLFEIKDGVMLQTPAMRGEAQKGTPYAAQRQQLEQSYGNLTSVLKSFAQCKVEAGKNKGKLAKKHWTLEQFQQIASMFNETWTEEDVEEMCAIDFDKDLIVTYRQGSETPATPMTQELKFFGALQQLGSLPPDILMRVVTPDKWAAIIEKAGEFGQLGFDVSGLEIDEMVAQKRYMDISNLCQPFQDVSFDQMEQMRQQVVGMKPPDEEMMAQAQQAMQANPEQAQQIQASLQGTPVTQLDLLTEQIFHKSQIVFSPFDDLNQQQTFFIEQFRVEQGKTKPNYVLMEMLSVLLNMIQQALAAQQQAATEKDPEVQAHNAELAAQQAELEAKQKTEATKMQLETVKSQADTELKHAELDLKKQELSIKAHEADANRLVDMMKHSEEGGETAEPTHLIDSVSTTFKDLPPSAQQEILRDSGIEVSKAELEKTAKANTQKPTVKLPIKK